MSHTRLTTSPTLWAPISVKTLPAPHFRYSPIVRAGSFLFVSGMVGLEPETGGLIAGGLVSESKRIFKNLQDVCDEIGISMHQLMLVRIYCADFTQFGSFNEVWNEYFNDQTPPARTSIGVSALPLGALIEMEFQFVVE